MSGITFDQLDPSAHAPWTSTMLVTPRFWLCCSVAPVAVPPISSAAATSAVDRLLNGFQRVIFVLLKLRSGTRSLCIREDRAPRPNVTGLLDVTKRLRMRSCGGEGAAHEPASGFAVGHNIPCGDARVTGVRRIGRSAQSLSRTARARMFRDPEPVGRRLSAVSAEPGVSRPGDDQRGVRVLAGASGLRR